jgi:adenylate kinase family enzyme
MNSEPKVTAALVAGPTGSGKTPFGKYLEQKGIWGRCCRHFDFGAQLRGIEACRIDAGLTEKEVLAVKDSLEKGTVFEPENYGIAEKLLRHFMQESGFTPNCLLILNGFPRDSKQADFIARLIEIRSVVELATTAETARKRIRLNSGGDRSGRKDDDMALVSRKIRDYDQRSQRLIQHLSRQGADIYRIPVTVRSKPDDMAFQLERQKPE